MFTLQYKEEDAHEEGGMWTCDWARTRESSAEDAAAKESETEEGKDQTGDNFFLDLQKAKNSEYKDFIVTGGCDDKVKIWDIEADGTLKNRHVLEGHSLGIVSVVASSDGRTVASSSMDSTLCFWNATSGECIRKQILEPAQIWTLAYSPCDKYVISGAQDGKVTMYSVETGEAEQVLDPQNGKFTMSIAYSPDGKYIASGAIDGIITIFDVAAGKVTQTLEGHAMPVRSLCFSPDSHMLLTASDDGHMKLYDFVHSDVSGTLSGHESWVLCVSFSENEKQFASCSSDKKVKIWDFNERKCIHTFDEHSDMVWGVKFSPTSDRLVSASEDKSINIYKCPPNVIV